MYTFAEPRSYIQTEVYLPNPPLWIGLNVLMYSVVIDDSGIRIPIEVFISWGQPNCIWYTGYSDQHLVRNTLDVNVRYWVKKLLRVKSATRLKCLKIAENEALFENNQIRIPNGSYGVANYEPIYQLMPYSSDLK